MEARMIVRNLITFLALSISFTSIQAQWLQTSGPNGGSITSLVSIGSDLYAGTRSGLFRSSDAGSSWSRMSGPMGSTSVDALNARGGDLFVSGSTGILRSTDRGTTWKSADAGLPGNVQMLIS